MLEQILGDFWFFCGDRRFRPSRVRSAGRCRNAGRRDYDHFQIRQLVFPGQGIGRLGDYILGGSNGVRGLWLGDRLTLACYI